MRSSAQNALLGVQVKDTAGSGSVTLNSESVRNAIAAFVDLVERNPDISVDLRFFTTSKIGKERAVADRPTGVAGLAYWKQAAAGADPGPLRAALESDKFPESVRAFSRTRDDEDLRRHLIKRIHWDCGKPDFPTLRQELEARLIVVGRDLFELPAPEASRLADQLVYQVLEKSIVDKPRHRVLTRATLYGAIDAATRISMPRSALDDYARVTSGLMASLGRSPGAGNLLSAGETGWLVDGATLPEPRAMIARANVESNVNNALANFGVAVLAGSSGLGKSIVSQAVAGAQSIGFFMVDFRNTTANEAGARLDMMFGRIGGLPPSTLILDDLNHLDAPQVSLSFARVIKALYRRNRKVIVSCYRKPSLKALTTAGLDQECIVECPYFSEKEASALVACYEGQPEDWGRLAHMAGGFGHPQLTHAFVNGMAARGWPIEEVATILAHGLTSDDTDAARDAARQNLLIALPEGTRTLLYRLSLTFGRFPRSMALTIGEISPPVSHAGECLDHLIGPWVETVGKDLFRISPLAGGSGGKTLSPNEIRHIHETIAIQMLANSTIDVSDIDVILVHAFTGKSASCLTKLAETVLLADSRTVAQLAEHVLFFRFLKTDAPIFPEDSLVSAVLRLVQFQLAAVTVLQNNISRIVAALFDEIASMPEGERKRVLEHTALMTVLSTMGIANHLDDWVALLLRLETMVQANEFLQTLAAEIETANGADGATFVGGLFSIGIANLVGVDRLEHIIDTLDEVDLTRRALLLSPIDRTQSDYSSFINGPWASLRQSADFNSVDAAMRYGRMADKTRNWGIRPLSLQCSVAQAIMLDEYLNDREGALAVLDEAVAKMGNDSLLSRAIAKVHWRNDEHHKVLGIFRGIADHVGAKNSVERAFALREAAISAAECGEWPQAEEWFLEARDAARVIQSDNMEVMAIGLGADSAVAALESDDPGRALTLLVEALETLTDIDPKSTLCAAYCHRVIRHTVLWAQSRIERSDVCIDGEPIRVAPGTCSNPDPLPAIQELPLAHIDLARYMLAEIEVVSGIDIGFSSAFRDRLEHSPIPVSEVSLRLKAIQADVERLDIVGFSNHFTSYLEAFSWMQKADRRLFKAFDPLAPERGQVPTLDLHPPFDAEIEQVAKDAILAYAIHAAFAIQPSAITELETALDNRFTGPFPGKTLFDDLNGNANIHGESDKIAESIIRALFRNDHLVPYSFWIAGLRIFEWINQSRFGDILVPKLAAWQRTEWRRILTTERFQLTRPMHTVPEIEDTLTISIDDRSFVARLLLTTSDAVGSSLAPDYQDALKAIAEYGDSSSSPNHNHRPKG